jgi:hypothetical protein
MPRTSTRWLIYGAVLALALIGIRVVDQPGGRAAPARVQAERSSPTTPHAAETIPELDVERLGRRTYRDTEADPFDARLATEAARQSAPPPAPPPAPQAPPVPFTYLGKLVEEGRVTVFLASGDRIWVARTGDAVGSAYRVEAIGERTMTLIYLPLDTRQEVAIGEAPQPAAAGMPSTSEPLPVSAPASALLPGQVPLLFAAPSRVATGNELTVSIGLPPGRGVRDARVELAYDPNVLSAVGVPAGDSGRVTVDFAGGAGPPAQVRFRAIAKSPTNTQIAIENAAATDARGARIAIATPGAHGVAIVQSPKAN